VGAMTETTPVQIIEKVRNRLATFLIGSFVGVIPFLLFKDIPEKNGDILVYMLGQLSGMAITVLGFYFVNKVGQDAADAVKSENTGKLADAITATAKAAGGNVEEPIADAADAVADAAADKADEIKGGKA
jgi:hypothetical protein